MSYGYNNNTKENQNILKILKCMENSTINNL